MADLEQKIDEILQELLDHDVPIYHLDEAEEALLDLLKPAPPERKKL